MPPRIGKIDQETFEQIILPRLGKKDGTVLVGPRSGVDGAVVELPGGEVMAIAEDPTFGMPVLMPHFGWSIVHISASDVAVLGLKPRYLTICLLLPPDTGEDVLEGIWQEVSGECEKLGIAIVGGHTGFYAGITYPLNGGCTVIGIGRRDELVLPSGAMVGDRVLITKGPAIEATGILAHQAEEELTRHLGREVVEKGKEYFFKMSVIQDALLSARYAHAMHDATEGGLLNGVYEVAQASGIGVTVYEGKIPISEETAAICGYFGLDPLISISEGTLVIAVPPENVEVLIRALKFKGIPAWEIGEITEGGRNIVRRSGKKEELLPVSVDPFWGAYFSTLGEK